MRLDRFCIVPVLIASLLSACKKQEPPSGASDPAPSKFTQEQLAAKFPNDLGPSTVDVSAYPQKIQEEYKDFISVCGSCHATARPLNAPYKTAYDWGRFVHRMHIKIENKGAVLDDELGKRIVDFLVYDSKVRKIGREKEFQAEQEKLKALYAEVAKEQERLVLKDTLESPKKETPYVGVK
ncbi:MAG: hypothetical protein A3A86_03215 [Elusimicrobia bacterium RIFCSPLOWO2_01_FULL_60_11]|nr:MAG: hypothetical protein A3A86_03215 [Elusimicrobia bacterium RIFCSPLOWO2_01_FULL_60_11]